MQSSISLGGAANYRLETTCGTGAANWRLPVQVEQRMTHVLAAFACWSSPLVEQRMTHLLSEQQWTAWRQPKLQRLSARSQLPLNCLEQQPKDPFMAGSFCGMVATAVVCHRQGPIQGSFSYDLAPFPWVGHSCCGGLTLWAAS